MDAFTEHVRSNVYNDLVPNLFVLYVLNCTVSKLHFGDSPSFSLSKAFTAKTVTGETDHWKRKKKKSERRTHTKNVLGLFVEKERFSFAIIYSESDAFVEYCYVFLMFISTSVKTNVILPQFELCFHHSMGTGSIC